MISLGTLRLCRGVAIMYLQWDLGDWEWIVAQNHSKGLHFFDTSPSQISAKDQRPLKLTIEGTFTGSWRYKDHLGGGSGNHLRIEKSHCPFIFMDRLQ